MNRTPRSDGRVSSWMGARPTRGAIALLVAELIPFLVYLAFRPSFMPDHLAMIPRLAIGREPWQVLTSGLIHLDFSSLLFAALTIWMFGTSIEQQVGRARMFAVFIGAQVAGSLAMALLGRALTPDALYAGCNPGVIGLIAAFGVVYAATPLSLFGVAQMRGRTLALMFIAFSLVQQLFRLEWVPLAGTVVGAAAGYAVVGSAGEQVSRRWERFRRWRIRRRYKVISGGRDQKSYLN